MLMFISLPISSCAYEEVFLQTEGVSQLHVPTYSEEIMRAEREHKENYASKRDENYFDKEEDVFESKAGRSFSRFVDNVIINNKLNQKITGYENRYLENEY